MPVLLYETDGTDTGMGFGAKAGFGFSWGNSSPIHEWFTWPYFLGVGSALFSVGVHAKDVGAAACNGAAVVNAFDDINQDQDHIDLSVILDYGAIVTDVVALDTSTGPDTYINGSHASNPIPILLGGNACVSAAGGCRLCDPDTGNANVAFTGSQNVITGVGFQPDIVIFIGSDSDGNNGDHDGLRFTIGCMDADGNQWVLAGMGVFASTPSQRTSEFRTDSCYLGLIDPQGTLGNTQGRNRASFASMDPDGFTINVEESNLYHGAGWYICIKVLDPTQGFFKVGTHVQGDTVGESGLPMTPGGVFLAADGWSPSIDGTPSTRLELGFGGFDTLTQRSTFGGGASGGSTPSQYYDDSALFLGVSDTQVATARALGTITGTGWSLAWDVDDGGARPFGSITFQCPNVVIRGNPTFDDVVPGYGVVM